MNLANMTFTVAESADISVIYQLAKDLIDQYEDTSAIAYDKVMQWMWDKISGNIHAYRCIMIDGVKAGYFHLDLSGEEAELDDLYILSDYQRMGIGTKVIQHCIKEANGTIFLYVFRNNINAIRLYTKMGFAVTEKVGNTRLIMRYNG